MTIENRNIWVFYQFGHNVFLANSFFIIKSKVKYKNLPAYLFYNKDGDNLGIYLLWLKHGWLYTTNFKYLSRVLTVGFVHILKGYGCFSFYIVSTPFFIS